MMDTSKAIPKCFHFRNWWTHTGLDYKNFEFHDRWAVQPVHYHYIDFGLSYQYPLSHKNMTETGSCGQDPSVPEFALDKPYDPFKVDVYQLGNIILHVARVSIIAVLLCYHSEPPTPLSYRNMRV
jgi:hypothetical protein